MQIITLRALKVLFLRTFATVMGATSQINHLQEFNSSKLSFTLQNCANVFHDFSNFNITLLSLHAEMKLNRELCFLKIENISCENLKRSQNRV